MLTYSIWATKITVPLYLLYSFSATIKQPADIDWYLNLDKEFSLFWVSKYETNSFFLLSLLVRFYVTVFGCYFYYLMLIWLQRWTRRSRIYTKTLNV